MMIGNYFKIALRSMLKHRIFSFINIFGLAISLSACLLMLSIIVVQYSYDEFHADAEQIYRINSTHHTGGDFPHTFATATPALLDYFEHHAPEVENTVVLKKGFGGDFSANDRIIPAKGLYASEDFLQTFTFPLQSGNPETALQEPFSLVLTQKVAEKFFGQQDPIGQMMSLAGLGEFKVTGLMADPPTNTHIKFEVLASYETLPALDRQGKTDVQTDNWQSLYDHYVYVKLQEGVGAEQLSAYFPQISQANYQENDPIRAEFTLQRLGEITPAPTAQIVNQLAPTMPAMFIYFMAGLVLVVMLSACFNYTNLSVARALSRAKEVGVRKVVGARRRQLFMQFISEAVIVSLLSLVLAVLMLQLLEPAFYNLLDEEGRSLISFATGYSIYVYFGIFALLVGLIAGVFPALLLSRFNPVQVLKKLTDVKVSGGMSWRKALITAQFALSFIFLITTMIIYEQFQYAMNKDMGFAQENVLQIALQGNSYEQLSQLMRQHKDVQEVSAASYTLASGHLSGAYFKKSAEDSLSIHYISVSPSFAENMELEMVAGEAYPENTDSGREQFVVFNESAVRAMGYESPAEAVNELLYVDGEEVRISGVVRDFHYMPVMQRIESFALRYRPEEFQYMQLKLSSTNIQATLSELEEMWQQLDKVHPFKAEFYDEQVAEALFGFNILMKVIGYMTFLSISIACLGFLGISIYTAETRMKEISIRKVLGAEVYQLSFYFMKSFLKLLLIAMLIGLPLAYLGNTMWLENIAYRREIGVGVLLLGAGSLLTLALLIVGSQAIKLAFINPVKTLRNE
jgi:ABC-type antimicrobial peptide transport system permease subunit